MKKINFVIGTLVAGSLAFYGCKKNDVNREISTNARNELVSGGEFSAIAQGNENNSAGAVYVLSNSVSGNEVLVFNRSSDGTLSPGNSLPTGGAGTGAGLGSQGALILHETGGNSFLFTVNAGTNDVSAFRFVGGELKWIDKVYSHGTTPISVSAHGDLLYVLHSGGEGNISGFRIGGDGHLTYIENSARALSSNAAGPAQIRFNNAGTQIVVTEKNTNRISTFSVLDNGLTSQVVVHASDGITPFGFDFDNHDQLIVSDAFGGAQGQSAVTSYKLANNGDVSLIDGPKGTHQTSACWLTITNNGKFCYVTNTSSASITGYRITDGILTLLNADGATASTGETPIDVSLSYNSRFLYNLNSRSHSITSFQVNADGSLKALGNLNGLPAGAVGIAVK